MTDVSTPFASALNVAIAIAKLLKPHCERIQIAGSVRRNKQNPKDVEILVIPKPSLWPFIDELLAMGHIGKATYGATNSTRWGKLYRGIQYDGMKVEIFTAAPETWGNQLLIRTGPGDANQRLMQILNRHTPIRFKDGAVWYSENWRKEGNGWEADDRQQVPLCEESDVFRLLGMAFVEPEARHERMYDQLSKAAHAWPDAREFLSKPKVTEMFAAGSDETHTIEDAALDEMRLAAQRIYMRSLKPSLRQLQNRAEIEAWRRTVGAIQRWSYEALNIGLGYPLGGRCGAACLPLSAWWIERLKAQC